MEPAERKAVSALAEEVSQALVRYARTLRAVPDVPAVGPVPTRQTREKPVQPRGIRQQELLKLRRMSAGLTAGEVAKALNLKVPNAYKLLSSMVTGGWIELVNDEEPKRWRKVT